MSDIMTVKETSAYLGVHEMTVYRLAKAGKLPGSKIGAMWRFKRSILDEMFKTNNGDAKVASQSYLKNSEE